MQTALPAEAPCNDLLGPLPEPAAWNVYWRGDNDGPSWDQWHDESDPLPAAWESAPPDEVTPYYTAEQMRAYAAQELAAERERCAKLVEEVESQAWALSLPGFDRMATDEQEAAMADAARFRWLGEVALGVDMVADPDNLVQVWHETLSGHATTGRTLREAVDEAMKRHNAGIQPR